MKVWEMDGTDIVRFEITRDQWTTLLTAIAGGSGWMPLDKRDQMYEALEILRAAEDVVDTNAMRVTLERIYRYAGIDDTYGKDYRKMVREVLPETTGGRP